MPIYFGMRVIITENRDKVGGFFKRKPRRRSFPFKSHSFCSLQSLTDCHLSSNQSTKRHLLSNSTVYSVTVAKAQGQTIPHVTIWFDKPKSSTATAYVAMSRVASFSCISFLKLSMASHFAQNQQ